MNGKKNKGKKKKIKYLFLFSYFEEIVFCVEKKILR